MRVCRHHDANIELALHSHHGEIHSKSNVDALFLFLFSSHTLRRTFGVTMSELGVSRDVIGALLGHAPGSVTVAAYIPVRWQEMLDAISRLTY